LSRIVDHCLVRPNFYSAGPQASQQLNPALPQSVAQHFTNEWVLNKAGVKRELLDTVKARKLAYYGHSMRKQGSCLEKEIMQATMPGARRRRRTLTAWMDNIKTWTGLSVEESIRMTEDRDKWRKYVRPTLGSRTAKEQNRVFRRKIATPSTDMPGICFEKMDVSAMTEWPRSVVDVCRRRGKRDRG